MIELAAAIRAGELSPVAVTDYYLRRTQELNDQVGAFFTVTAELAAEQARAAEKAVAMAEEPRRVLPRCDYLPSSAAPMTYFSASATPSGITHHLSVTALGLSA